MLLVLGSQVLRLHQNSRLAMDRGFGPRPERLNELFAHMREVVEHPEIEPDLRKIEDEQHKR